MKIALVSISFVIFVCFAAAFSFQASCMSSKKRQTFAVSQMEKNQKTCVSVAWLRRSTFNSEVSIYVRTDEQTVLYAPDMCNAYIEREDDGSITLTGPERIINANFPFSFKDGDYGHLEKITKVNVQ